ncbi:patatin-like phospholipase-like protein [Echria macrotheca]|uniref:Patatin-like phospholipase-like protein n=1 Tax=Echria macrotheca TaxID=438768 RepID=A0AAJ0BBB5_9PEZI|nr:patatin-like phospholipase-like protein [Echria macrotheca]
MKQCKHTFWLGLCAQATGTDLLVSDSPDVQAPSFLLFGIKRAQRFSIRRGPGEVHLHVDPSKTDVSERLAVKVSTEHCHEISRRSIKGIKSELSGRHIANVLCFFCDDLGGFKQVAHYVAAWLDHPSTIPAATRPRVVLVTEKIPGGVESEKKALNSFLMLLKREIKSEDLLDQISSVDVVVLFPSSSISVDTRYRRLKERLMEGSDLIRRKRQDSQLLFSATHFGALVEGICERLPESIMEPFNFIKHARMYNPVATDLDEHISEFLTHIKSPDELNNFAAPVLASSFFLDCYPPGAHRFRAVDLFRVLYKDMLIKANEDRVIAFDGYKEVILRSGFITKIEKFFEQYSERSVKERLPSAEIHRANLQCYQDLWHRIKSNNTCFLCLRRRPQHQLHCGHEICENCVVVFGKRSIDDPWVFEIDELLMIRIHPPTAGVGILCVDGGGIRATAPLGFMKRIKNRVDLPIAIQRFFKLAVGVSSDLFINGNSIEQSTERFENLVECVFQRRNVLTSPFMPRFLKSPISRLTNNVYPFFLILRFLELFVSYFADGLYSSENIEATLKQAFGIARSILDVSHATSTGTRVGLPVATVEDKPSCKIFTNYNGVGERKGDNELTVLDNVIKPRDNLGKILLWEVARAASAAPGFFPPKYIKGIGTFQDAGPLENDPLVSALSELAALFPLVEEPDFVVSLGTGEPKPSHDSPKAVSRNVWKNGAFPRLCRLFWEKMRDKKVREAFQSHPRYHRLNVQFEGDEPRLDDVQSIPDVKLKVQDDPSVCETIDNIARCMIASLFYFELDSRPQRLGGKPSEPAFGVLFNRLSTSGQFWINGAPVADIQDDSCFDNQGNFRIKVEINTDDRFTVTLKQDSSEPCNISGSPFSVRKLILLQGLCAVFGSPDHRKRKDAAFGTSDRRRVPSSLNLAL